LGTSSASYTAAIVAWHSGSANQSADAQQRYVTSSPPFDLGEGEAAGFLFLLLDKQGNVKGHYLADVPPWGYNGPTDIRATAKCKLTGKKYNRVAKKRTLAEIIEGVPTEYELREITNEVKNADMQILPTPFSGIGKNETIVCVDPMDFKIRNLVEHQNDGGGSEIVDAIMAGKIHTSDDALKRKGPKGVKITPLIYK
jgi:hypothetical protein